MSHLATGLVGFALGALVGWLRLRRCREQLAGCREAYQLLWTARSAASRAAPDDDWRDAAPPTIRISRRD